MSSIKNSSNKINLLNNRVKYGTDGGIIVNSGTFVVDEKSNNIGIQTARPTYKLDISTNDISAARIGNTLFVDSSNNRIGIQTARPTYKLDISLNDISAARIGNTLIVDSSNNNVTINGALRPRVVYPGIKEFFVSNPIPDFNDIRLTPNDGEYIIPIVSLQNIFNPITFILPNAIGNNGLSYTFLSNNVWPYGEISQSSPVKYILKISTPLASTQAIYFNGQVVTSTDEIMYVSKVVAYNGNWFWFRYVNSLF